MNIVADESVDYAIIQALRETGFEVYSITEHAPGVDDNEVLMIANKHKCLLLTEDKDFGKLTNRMNIKHHGILLIRLSRLPRNERTAKAVKLFKSNAEKLKGKFSVIDENGIRIRG